jgi:hypothetical protein
MYCGSKQLHIFYSRYYRTRNCLNSRHHHEDYNLDMNKLYTYGYYAV